jgi:hypothetical protein
MILRQGTIALTWKLAGANLESYPAIKVCSMPQQSITPSLPTSLRKGQIGVIHAFASLQQRRRNAVVITHELIRTFDA